MNETSSLVIVTNSPISLRLHFSCKEDADRIAMELGKLIHNGTSTVGTLTDSNGANINVVLRNVQYFYVEQE